MDQPHTVDPLRSQIIVGRVSFYCLYSQGKYSRIGTCPLGKDILFWSFFSSQIISFSSVFVIPSYLSDLSFKNYFVPQFFVVRVGLKSTAYYH